MNKYKKNVLIIIDNQFFVFKLSYLIIFYLC